MSQVLPGDERTVRRMTGSSGHVRRQARMVALATLVLLVVGLVILSSTGSHLAETDPENPYASLRRQLLWLALGLPLMGVAFLVDLRWLRKFALWIHLVAFLLLMLCFVPGIGLEINGERRWVNLGGVRFQPSEPAKLALVLALAAWFGRSREDRARTRLVIPGLLAAGILVPVALEVDIGTTAVLAGAAASVFFVAGMDRRWLWGGAGFAVLALGALVLLVPGRMDRVWAVLEPERHARGVGLQQHVAKVALGSGGIDGVGLGAGRMKMLYMPYAHTDFVFPMIGEELGLGATLLVLGSFVAITWAGLSIAARSPSRFGQLLGVGLGTAFGVQALLNIAVTTGVWPNTGLPLPLVSYGGSSLVTTLVGLGLLSNLARRGSLLEPRREDWQEAEPAGDRG